MEFEAELRAFLEEVEQDAPPPQAVKHRSIDVEELRSHLLQRLRESERERWVRVTHERWSPRLVALARYVEGLPATVAPIEPDAAMQFTARVLDCAIDCMPETTSLVDRLELGRLLAGFRSFVSGDGGPFDVLNYAVENKLVVQKSDRAMHLTPLGWALRRLRGKDAVRWLLIVEVTQNVGLWDHYHVSPELLETALSEPLETFVVHDRRVYPYDWMTLRRLESLGVLTGLFEHRESFELVPSMRDVVEAALGDGPWHRAVAAVLEDERAVVVPQLRAGTTDAALEQTKLVAHEVRNALIPARFRLEALRAVALEPQLSHLEAVRRGVTRVLTFVEDMVATSELVTEPAASCDPAALIGEAVAWVEDSERVWVEAPSGLVRVRAPRSRLVRSIVNLLRNAIQATPDGHAIRITARRRADAVQIVVDDAGPGVADDARERVFQEGYTTRSEGSGYGLAYVRHVVVDDLRGRVWCEASDLGGARFVIELPGIEVES